jgi:hypothetical protein
MMLAETELPEDPWELLQQPDCPSGKIDARYRLLLAALDMGWQVEEPVLLRSRWGESGPWVYHFILRRAPGSTPRLLSVRASPEVEQFLRLEGFRLSATRNCRFYGG